MQKKKNKYTYYKIIQEYYEQWEDSDFHETNANFYPIDNKAFKENLKAYKENSQAHIRVICRKELNQG